jgi:putative ABC transport system permease protein
MQNRDLGINIDQTLVVNAPGFLAQDSLYGNYLQVYKNSISTHSAVKSFTATTEVPGNLIFWINGAQ